MYTCMYKCRHYIMIQRLYNWSSSMDRGTLYRLQKVINRQNVVKDPNKNFAAYEEFFFLVVEAHVLAAAHLFSMLTLEDALSEGFFPIYTPEMSSLQQRRILIGALHKQIMWFFNVSFKENVSSELQYQAASVNQNATEVLCPELLSMEFNDALNSNDSFMRVMSHASCAVGTTLCHSLKRLIGQTILLMYSYGWHSKSTCSVHG